MDIKTIIGATAMVALLATPALSQTTGAQPTGPSDAAPAAKSSADTTGTKGATGTKKTERHHRSHMGKVEHHRHHMSQHSAMRGDRYLAPGAVAPGAVAAGVVGGAVGTAGAIATSPFGMWDDSYAYYPPGGAAPQAEPFKFDDNGPTCQRGTWVTINGLRYPCQ